MRWARPSGRTRVGHPYQPPSSALGAPGEASHPTRVAVVWNRCGPLSRHTVLSALSSAARASSVAGSGPDRPRRVAGSGWVSAQRAIARSPRPTKQACRSALTSDPVRTEDRSSSLANWCGRGTIEHTAVPYGVVDDGVRDCHWASGTGPRSDAGRHSWVVAHRQTFASQGATVDARIANAGDVESAVRSSISRSPRGVTPRMAREDQAGAGLVARLTGEFARHRLPQPGSRSQIVNKGRSQGIR